MKKEYDFSKGVRGKFYRPGLKLELPIYLDSDNKTFFEKLAVKKRKGLSILVNDLLRKEKEIVEAVM